VQMLGEKLNAGGSPVWGQQDAEPCQGSYPTTAWEAGDIVLTRHQIAVAQDAPAGDYRLSVGMYDAPTGERLPVRDAAGQEVAERSATFMSVQVTP